MSSSPGSAPVPAPSTSSLTPMLRVLIGFAAAAIGLVGLYLGRELVGPLLLGAVIVIICHPIRHRFDRRGLPKWVGTSLVVLLAYVVLGALALLLSWAGIEFVDLVVVYSTQLQESAEGLLTWLESLGLETQIADAAASLLEPSTIMGWAQSLGGAVLGVLTGFFLVLAYVIFMAADGGRYTGAERTFGAERAATVDRFREFNSSIRRYFTVNATFGAIVAIIDGLALAVLNVPAPAVWAVLAFVTNFIPNIGFILGLVPPMVLALMVGGWPLMLAVVAVYSVVNVVLQVLVQPKFVSDAVSLSLTLSFFSVLFWTFVIGPLGAILAIPLTLMVRALVLEIDPGSTWLRWLSGDAGASPALARSEAAAAAALETAAADPDGEATDPDSDSEAVATDSDGESATPATAQ